MTYDILNAQRFAARRMFELHKHLAQSAVYATSRCSGSPSVNNIQKGELSSSDVCPSFYSFSELLLHLLGKVPQGFK